MKKLTGSLLALLLISAGAFCQEGNYKQAPTLGIHFFFSDYQTAASIRNTSLGTTLRDKQFAKIKNMSPGLAVNYIQGLNNSFDFTSTLAGSFVSYTLQNGTAVTKDEFLLEGDVSVRGKMFPNKYFFTPYAQLGIGASKYKGYYGAFIPLGLGLQVNLFDEAYLLINSQYRVPVTQTANYHFFWSIGFAASLEGKK